jgi:hypothetical protein
MHNSLLASGTSDYTFVDTISDFMQKSQIFQGASVLREVDTEYPQQPNHSDCGLFTVVGMVLQVVGRHREYAHADLATLRLSVVAGLLTGSVAPIVLATTVLAIEEDMFTLWTRGDGLCLQRSVKFQIHGTYNVRWLGNQGETEKRALAADITSALSLVDEHLLHAHEGSLSPLAHFALNWLSANEETSKQSWQVYKSDLVDRDWSSTFPFADHLLGCCLALHYGNQINTRDKMTLAGPAYSFAADDMAKMLPSGAGTVEVSRALVLTPLKKVPKPLTRLSCRGIIRKLHLTISTYLYPGGA